MPSKPAIRTGLILRLAPCNVRAMLKLRILILTAALSALACGHGPPPEPKARLTRQQFVAVMVDVEKAQPTMRPKILQEHHVTEADLKEFMQKYSATPEYLSQVLDSIQGAVDRQPAAR